MAIAAPIGMPGREPRVHLVERHLPVRDRVDATEVVDEFVRVDPAPMPVGQLWHEVRLVRDRQLRVAVEHDAEKGRPRTPHAEDEEGRSSRRQVLRTRSGAERLPARSSATSVSRMPRNRPVGTRYTNRPCRGRAGV